MKLKYLTAIISLLILATSCNFFQGETTTSGRGLQVTVLTAPNIQGKTLTEFDTFTVTVDIINNMESPVQGQICLRDQTTDIFGGIPSSGENCENLNLLQAERTENNLYQEKATFFFPKYGEFSYRDLDETTLPNQVFVDLFYEARTINGGTACVEKRGLNACPQQEQTLTLRDNDAPFDVTKIKATPSYRQNEVVLNTEITVKQKEEGNILSPGSLLAPNVGGSQKVRVNVEIDRRPAVCRQITQGYLELRKDQNEKVIKCTQSLTIPVDFVNVPVTVSLEYGFQKTVAGPKFNLKMEENVYA